MLRSSKAVDCDRSRCGRLVMLVVGALAVGAMLLAGGCGAPAKKSGLAKGIFYPPAPDMPRLQFLMSFSTAEAWVRKRGSFADFIVGGEEQQTGVIGNPYGVAAVGGKVYVCDVSRRRVQVIDIAGERYFELTAPGGLRNPVNVNVAPDGRRYVCDTGLRKIAVYDRNDVFIEFLGDPQRCVPNDVAFFGDELFVVDIAGGKLEVWNQAGELQRVISSKGTGPDQLRVPTNIELDASGLIYVTDTEQQIVKVFTLEGRFVRSIGAPGDRPGFFARPKGIAIDPDGRIYVADAQWERVQIFAPEGQLLMFFGGPTAGPEGMGLPAGLALDTSSFNVFGQYVDPGFNAQYLLFVANQFGQNKIGVYAFGHPRGVDPGPVVPSRPQVESADSETSAETSNETTTEIPAEPDVVGPSE